jgi:hypothetical protein
VPHSKTPDCLLRTTERSRSYLPGHDFTVDAANVDSGVKAGLVVGVNDVAPKRLIRTGTAVVWSLRKRCTQEFRTHVVSFYLGEVSKA